MKTEAMKQIFEDHNFPKGKFFPCAFLFVCLLACCFFQRQFSIQQTCLCQTLKSGKHLWSKQERGQAILICKIKPKEDFYYDEQYRMRIG